MLDFQYQKPNTPKVVNSITNHNNCLLGKPHKTIPIIRAKTMPAVNQNNIAGKVTSHGIKRVCTIKNAPKPINPPHLTRFSIKEYASTLMNDELTKSGLKVMTNPTINKIAPNTLKIVTSKLIAFLTLHMHSYTEINEKSP